MQILLRGIQFGDEVILLSGPVKKLNLMPLSFDLGFFCGLITSYP